MGLVYSFYKQLKIHKGEANSLSQTKYFFRWTKSFEQGASSVKDEQPWITFDAINFLNKVVTRQSMVFEYGGGGSTLFFTNRAKHVVTVEHNKEWFRILSDLISKKKLSNWEGCFIEPQAGNYVEHPEKSNPDHYASGDANSENFHFHDYATYIDKFPDEYFDVVLVDGRSRASCIKHSIPKLKKGGYLVLDNSDREYYLKTFNDKLAKDFIVKIDTIGASPYSLDFTKTSIWQKK